MLAGTNAKKRYGWKPDVPDFRDIHYSAVHGVAPVKLPDQVDLRQYCTPIEDQGDLGSCTGHAISGAMELLVKKNSGQTVQLSRLFIYYNERAKEGTVASDAGAQIRTGIKGVRAYGSCLESMWAYDITKFTCKPTPGAYLEGLKHRVSAYQRVVGLDAVLNSLASGLPVVFGFSVYESFESDAVAKTGVMPMPSQTERCLGGHAVCAVGYDLAAKKLIVRNSWGTDWGQKGYFMMPFDIVTNKDLSDDFWSIQI